MNKSEYKFTVETIRKGQPKAYADSEYEYIITTSITRGNAEFATKQFCTSILQPCRQTYEEWVEGKGNACVYFTGYYRFEQDEGGAK